MGEPQEASTWWPKLPEKLQMEVLAWLPWECLCRYRGVCREWNALFSSTKFITEQWAAAPPNKKPSLLVFNWWDSLFSWWDSLRCMAYCFFRKTWKPVSFSFLTRNYPDHMVYWGSFESSASGLFLVTIKDTNLVVCNPLTGASLKLPTINPDANILSTRIMGGEGYREAIYKVVAVVQSGDEKRIEIYDSSSKSWTTAGYLQEDFEVSPWEKETNWMVICDNFLYCLAYAVDSEARGVIAFNIQNGASIFRPLPQIEVANCDILDHILSCGSRILIATCISKEDDSNIQDIILWELGKEERTFHQIARIFPENFRGKNYSMSGFEFEGIGDLICIKHDDCLELFVYNLKENSWSRLPTCPILEEDTPPGCFIKTLFGFEPRPGMKVE